MQEDVQLPRTGWATLGVALEHWCQLAHLPELARPQQVGPPVSAVDELQVAEVDVPQVLPSGPPCGRPHPFLRGRATGRGSTSANDALHASQCARLQVHLSQVTRTHDFVTAHCFLRAPVHE